MNDQQGKQVVFLKEKILLFSDELETEDEINPDHPAQQCDVPQFCGIDGGSRKKNAVHHMGLQHLNDIINLSEYLVASLDLTDFRFRFRQKPDDVDVPFGMGGKNVRRLDGAIVGAEDEHAGPPLVVPSAALEIPDYRDSIDNEQPPDDDQRQLPQTPPCRLSPRAWRAAKSRMPAMISTGFEVSLRMLLMSETLR